ncbi:MAG: class I SAM-dependent methyltransferase [Dongiaceae bacterium]
MQTEEPTQSWSEENSATFIAYGRFFNPERERQFDVIGDLVAAALGGETSPLVLELCCGAGDLAACLLGRFPTAQYLALDGSKAMRAEATRQCAQFRDRFATQHFDLGSDDWRQMRGQPRAIVSSLAVHHLDGQGKRKLFRDLHAMLAPGGAFVLADIMQPTSPTGFEVAAEVYERVVAERSLRERGDLSMLEKLRELRWNYFRHPDDDSIDQPSGVAEQLLWLGEAGFRGVDIHWALAGHAIVSGVK